MADEENLQEMVEDNDDTEPALISTPTQDELPDFISLPGVSASGIQAAASALRGLRSSQGMDEISDSELNVDQDLGDLAVLPVDKPDEEDRLSGVSNVSSVKEKENGKKDDDEISLSGLSSNDDDPNRLQIEDVEDGEITKTVANVEMNGTASHRTRSRSSSSDSSTTPNAGNGKNRSRRRFRKRSSGSSEKNSSEERNQSLRKSQSPSRSRSRSRRSGTPRSSVPKRRNQKELPRYDVRNVINRKRAARSSKRKSKSPSRSRSKSRSRRRGRSKSRSRSKSPVSAFRSRNASRRSPIRSRSPVRNSGGNKRSKRPQRSWSPSKSRSRSHSPPPRNRFRSRQRSRSPMLRRNRTRSPLRNRSRSPPLRNRLDRSKSPKSKKRSPRSARNTKKKNKPRSKSRSRSRSPVTARKSKGKKKNRPNRVNDTDSTSKSKKKSKKSKRNNRTVTAANDNNDVHFNSSVANKEVYTSGDKIMVSVNFKNAANKSAAEIAASTKPSLVIDVMSSPYQIIEPSPEPVFDIFSDDEKENNQSKIVNENQENSIDIEQQERTSGGADLHIIEELSRGGPCTPPTENLDLAKGPQTPTEDPMDYDPCNPTESPLDDSLEIDDAPLIASSPSSSDGSNNGHRDELLKTAANTIPFLMDDSLVSNNSKATAAEKNNDTNDLNDMPIDMDMDSPFSPASSEASDIFEPPSLKGHKKSKTNGIKSHKAGASNNNKHVKMKVVDDKLKIIDDVPTSAVEMAVKEKFLKKVQRQERIVEEIKTVLKPHYNRKRITKEDYKDILRKCVPKVCHSKKGDINPTKIQKLVKGYVRKYHHSRKRMLNSS